MYQMEALFQIIFPVPDLFFPFWHALRNPLVFLSLNNR